MIVYRIGKSKFARDLSGEGARLNGGRWNHKLTPCIYTSETRALALLEYSANVGIEDIPNSLSITAIEIPDASIITPAVRTLPRNWQEAPAPASTRDFGTELLRLRSTLAFKVPSVILPQEFNIILNPAHPDSRLLKIVGVSAFVYDARIKGV